MAYRWMGAHAYRDHANDRSIEPGEELPEDIAEQVADAHPHDVERVEDDSDEVAAEAPEVPDPPFDPAEYTVDELHAALDDGDYSDAELDALADAEAAEEGRTTALEAIADYRR